jgi:hypothetical protein
VQLGLPVAGVVAKAAVVGIDQRPEPDVSVSNGACTLMR